MESKDTLFSGKQTMNLGGKLLTIDSPVIMGILNITPDSFFDGGKYLDEKPILQQCQKMMEEGAAIIDIGAYSSRPGAEDITPADEWSRLKKALKPIRDNFPDIFLSVDTFRSDIAERVIKEFGVQIINDISCGTLDNKMFEIVAINKAAYIMMHMRGNPKNMQNNTIYTDLVNEIIRFFADKTAEARSAGIHDIIIDPGFGFSKTLHQNFELLQNLDKFSILQRPILVGLSRKSMIYKTLNTTPDKALAGTIAANTIALMKGANILRVHDVKEAIDALAIVNLMN